ncbi:MAG: hypothetical protein H7836_06310 [Magnetococcus sp. YQC-3]
MFNTIPLTTISQGFLRLNKILLPLSLCLLLFIGSMAGGGPASPGAVESLLTVAAFLFLLPFALLLFHALTAKLFDALLGQVPLAKAEISWVGVVLSAVLLVVMGNIFVDDLYQFKRGDYTLSVWALLLDLGGMAAVVVAGGGKQQ